MDLKHFLFFILFFARGRKGIEKNKVKLDLRVAPRVLSYSLSLARAHDDASGRRNLCRYRS